MSGSILEQAAAIVGAKYVQTNKEDTDQYLRDWRGRYEGRALGVILPGNTEEVSRVVQLCSEFGVCIVPQGGNTGLTGGAVPQDAAAVVLNVSRLNRVHEVDAANNSMVVEAGCILANVRDEAEKHDRQFPMLLGSVGSCEIGGLISTNAGGTGVLRYGNMRELVLGIEAVLPDGRIWNGLKSLRKDNSGYDLKQLFIGAEGTLGIVTAASLKLYQRPVQSATAMVATADLDQVIKLLHLAQKSIGNRIEAFEVMSMSQLKVVLKHRSDFSSPMPVEAPWYVLIEIADSAEGWGPSESLEAVLAVALEQEIISDAAIATDLAKAAKIWELRHNISEANKHEGFTVSNDTSVPISAIPEFIARVDKRLATLKSATICHVGHVGDGNIHVIAVLPRDIYNSPDVCEEGAATVNAIIHEETVALNGSISAEHGIGIMHVSRLEHFKPSIDLDMMRAVKAAFDPKGLMNPGKIFNV
ncbi:MAG: FAD-binding oxidoreductase [Ferrovibrio sp.]|uniref:FAD-binding oxidoreductase n=1 Tax=Ferrovibrio sp. TaxID=1917215 RepID=UPI0026128739|nr:FAD-binding oxidoreductase [Ferrovibrio sp.]MCW0235034.1 FAD-binding oxidoreductase [Ferrovibrio sp.]